MSVSEANTQTDPWVGRVIADQFRITRRLGAGGMGSVYLADQLGMDRQVVLKVILDALSQDVAALSRFEREALTLAKLRHPNVVQVFMSGRTPEGALYLVMEFVEGRELSKEMKAGPMPEARARHIAEQIAAALATAHAAGIVHRDLKPANVMLTAHPGNPDHVVVLDFGIAKVLAEGGDKTKLTQTGWMMGTPAYMSPEQIEGKAVDGRSDIYSLGVMVYEMATGANPFVGDTPWDCFMRHLKEPVPPPSERYPELAVTRPFEITIQRCLAKRPEDRYPTAEALLHALRGVAHGSLTAVGPAPPTFQPAQAKKPGRALAFVGVALLVAVGILVALLISDDGETSRSTAGDGSENGTGTIAANLPGSSAGSTGDPTANPAGGSQAAQATDDEDKPPDAPQLPPGIQYSNTGQPRIVIGPGVRIGPGVTIDTTQPRTTPPVRPNTTPRPGYASPSMTPPQIQFDHTPNSGAPGLPSNGTPNLPAQSAPPAEPVLTDEGPWGTPIPAGSRLRSSLGTLSTYASSFDYETTADLYQERFSGGGMMVNRGQEAGLGYMSIMAAGANVGFSMIIVAEEAGGSVELRFFQ